MAAPERGIMKSIVVLALVFLLLVPTAAAMAEGTSLSIGETGYTVTVPQTWQAVQPGPALAQYVHATDDGELVIHLSYLPGLSEYSTLKDRLSKSSENNSVTDIRELDIDGRMWITHHMQLQTLRIFSALTLLDDGSILALEFRTKAGKDPWEAFGQEIREVLQSVSKEGALSPGSAEGLHCPRNDDGSAYSTSPTMSRML